MTWNIPNILTLLRLLAAPCVAVMFLYFDRPWADWFALVLFVSAAVTDFVDGYLARAWKQESKFGAMMDPIADKAMVVIALVVITGFSGMNPWILMPAVLIIFREVFVSGLREFLGDTAGLLKVTQLAKWKTTMQMVAIAVLFAKGAFEHYQIDHPAGEGFSFLVFGANVSWALGIGFLWVAMLLTVLSGADYFIKSLPYLRDSK
ncbi:CDP-diacylglycerol--glycerol-3-phosphate 3-phosphatidyltransferase [Yoonia sp. MH D7]